MVPLGLMCMAKTHEKMRKIRHSVVLELVFEEQGLWIGKDRLKPTHTHPRQTLSVTAGLTHLETVIDLADFGLGRLVEVHRVLSEKIIENVEENFRPIDLAKFGFLVIPR